MQLLGGRCSDRGCEVGSRGSGHGRGVCPGGRDPIPEIDHLLLLMDAHLRLRQLAKCALVASTGAAADAHSACRC